VHGEEGWCSGLWGSILENFDFNSRKLKSQLLYLSKLSSTIIFKNIYAPFLPPPKEEEDYNVIYPYCEQSSISVGIIG
jgi:hypothetical protein